MAVGAGLAALFFLPLVVMAVRDGARFVPLYLEGLMVALSVVGFVGAANGG